MTRYADVALPVTIDRAFTYLVPPELEEAVAPGVRAIVPFGRKYLTGLIVDLPLESSVKGLKPLRDVIDSAPVVSEELLWLCRWIASYYFASLGEVLKTALPQGFSSSSKRLARLTPAATPQVLRELERHAPKRALVANLLAQSGALSASALARRSRARNIHAVLNALAQAGLVETGEFLRRTSAEAKTIGVIPVQTIHTDAIAQALHTLPARRKRARALLETLLQCALEGISERPVADILRRSNAPASMLKQFAASGYVQLERRTMSRLQEYGTDEQTLGIVLNDAQQHVLAALQGALSAGSGGTFLLHGVTGSGKTQVYIEAIRSCLALGRSAIVLVPEISLTPQMVRRFKSHFGADVVVVHSRMPSGERQDAWRLVHKGGARIVIGPRSAIFAPLEKVGLIVVDEEHEASYKQYDSSPRYHARDVAVVRGDHAHAVVVLGSATPSAESYANALSGKYALLEMRARIDDVPMPSIRIVDMVQERKIAYAARRESLPPEARGALKGFAQGALSRELQEKIRVRLERKEGIILLQNRRGFAPFVSCAECGFVEMCDNCNVTMTFHLAKKHLRCHYCGAVRSPHLLCPACGGVDITLRGIGTQKVEQELASVFPEAKVQRMDLDTTTARGSHDRILKAFGEGKTDILLGTQMVAKGLDFARVTLVGVISADTQMLLPDFRSSERTFQLLTQVAGRAGRSVLSGEVVIQTHQAGHYTLAHVVDHDFRAFYAEELKTREELSYPPFSRLALVECTGENEQRVQREAERFGTALNRLQSGVMLLGPAPAVIAKIKNRYRWHIILKSRKEEDPGGGLLRRAIQSALGATEKDRARDVRTVIDVDPVGLM
ncbi:MAG TPA: primosomal protein N' [Bacteroidota bacterium]|nr:primosomal protein N' [Bacteroidota bacterium]